ncbi:YCII-related protein (plasmid) [Sulfuricurvum kujiense DSM 16994]|uniref:YCII-related protein n=1 Tax=Sulfuricurvum kujiense (strain ATCC BAA-921 / DSM 16994 / JCM 11577 / YK-1) TaxID=709032 RepID=E4U3Y6_SULKY|nr:YciI family protein [Sulfuricurvum kujiense]ADR35402.1 YCII-related protein [Sulfuricurvum kujiense DSM 16994]
MFIVSLTYIKPLEEVDALLDEHVAYLKEQYALGNFVASGRKVPRTGGVILARSVSREEIETIITLDPFYRHHVAEYEISEFSPTMSVDELVFLRE